MELTKMKPLVATLINPFSEAVTSVVIDGNNTLAELRRLIGCDLVTCVNINDDNDLWLDDEGLFADKTTLFRVDGLPQDYAGKGVVLGLCYETGESKSTSIPPESLSGKVEFLGEVHEPEQFISASFFEFAY